MLYATIEIGRGLAALAVFSFHLKEPINEAIPALNDIAGVGHFGVTWFFVISGYCMMAASVKAQNQEETARSFLFWRFMRIYPPFWLSIATVVLVPFTLALLGFMKSGVSDIPAAKWMDFSIADWLLHISLLQVFATEGAGLSHAFNHLNIVYWSLAIEFQFYLVICLALALKHKFEKTLILITLMSVAMMPFPSVYATGIFLPYWPMFGLGLVLYKLLDLGLTPDRVFGRSAYLATMLLLCLVGVADIAFVTSDSGLSLHLRYAHLSNFLQAVVATFCLWLVVPLDRTLVRISKNRNSIVRVMLQPLFILGTISYSLYLLHAKISQIPAAFVRQVLPENSPLSPILTMVGTIVISYLFYLGCERPFMRRYWKNRMGRQQ